MLRDWDVRYERIVREKDSDIEKLRKRIADLEPLRDELTDREKRLREWDGRYTRTIKEKDDEIERLKKQIADLKSRPEQVRTVTVVKKQKVRAPKTVKKVKAPRKRKPREYDDLKRIYGVGRVLEKLLHKNGIFWFKQVATWTDNDIDTIDAKLEKFHGRIRRENWVRSATEEHYKKYNEWLGEGEPKVTMPETR
jgi:predicted flap endonuclease-1-like 5' DNA nuclease